MDFYTAISDYYEYIFPAGNAQLKFLRDKIGDSNKKVLDIACGSGEYSIAIAGDGNQVTAVDLDPLMIKNLNAKANEKNLEIITKVLDMKLISENFSEQFDMIFCIGNSIVHLENESEILSFLKSVNTLLKPNGTVVFQIINYDRIINKKVTSLPPIKNDNIGLSFERNYIFNERNGKIIFDTKLSIKNNKEDNILKNQIELVPLKSEDFAEFLAAAGFKNIRFYGNFNEDSYSKDESYALVVSAEANVK